MLKRLTQKLAHTLATTMFSLLEVLGLPRLGEADDEEDSQ